MRPARSTDLDILAVRLGESSQHSFVVLASLYGYSRTELDCELSVEGNGLYVDDGANLLIRICDVDLEQASLRVQFCGEDQPGRVDTALRRLCSGMGIERIYSYLFPWEAREIALLAGLGFAREAVLREHVQLRGRLCDIEIYGRCEVAA
jgi:hypothetical protein